MKTNNKNIKLDNALMIVAIIAVGFAFVNLMTTIDKFRDIQSLTGYATDTGTANLTIQSTASVNFTLDLIDWGSGYVNANATSATLVTNGTMVGTTGFNTVSNGLTIENIGNNNVTLNLSADKNAATFVGGTTPAFQWNVTNNDTSKTCDPGINISSYPAVDTTMQVACTNMGWESTMDSLEIDLRLVIPNDATAGVKGTVITATAATIP